MSQYQKFKEECAEEIANQGRKKELREITNDWMTQVSKEKYCYHFEWLGRPIIQYPQDIVAMQELIFKVQPDLIIETGIAHGGSIIYYSSLLELNAIMGGPKDAEVVAVDIDIREHNRKAIEEHPMSKRITMIQGSSIDEDIVNQVKAYTKGKKKVLVCLDSNHTHDHVLEELKAYAQLTSVGSYCVVFDTIVEDQPDDMYPDRPWGVGDNPKTAAFEYLKTDSDFEIDKEIDDKILISVTPDGFLKRVK